MNSRDNDGCKTDVFFIAVIAYVAYIFLVIGTCALVVNLGVNSFNPKQHIVYIDPHTLHLTVRYGKDTWTIN